MPVEMLPNALAIEYGQELEYLLRRERPGIATVCDVLAAAFKERVKEPFVRLALFCSAACAFTFLLALLFARPIWHFLAAPVARLLRDEGVRPAMLISDTPWEQLAVIWFGIPTLVTVLVMYPCMLWAARRWLAQSWHGSQTQEFLSFARRSAALSVFSVATSLIAWRNGSIAWLIHDGEPISLTRCFEMLIASTFGAMALLQLPLLLSFYRERAKRARRGRL